MRTVIVCLVAMIAAGPFAQAEDKPSKVEATGAQVLVLGVYHMANPGHDVYNLQADDVLLPKRQQEIAELVAVLKTFQPTKIAVEANSSKDFEKRYADYVAGARQLSRNEVEQVGFRLAKDLGHTAVYGVDADGDFPLLRVTHYAKATGQAAKLEAHMEAVGQAVREFDEYLKTHTVLQALLYLNSDQRAAHDIGWYYLAARYGEPGDYAGPDLLAEWYRRNVRIYSNVAKLVTSPDDRILVIFGYGHLGWLRQDFAADPTLRLRRLEEFVRDGRR